MNENEGAYQSFTPYAKQSNNRGRILYIFAGLILLVIIIVAGLFIIGSTRKRVVKVNRAQIAQATATPLPTSSISAVLKETITAEPTGTSLHPTSSSSGLAKIDSATKLNRADLAIAVLNGSGEKGAAAGVSNYLGGLGYKIARVGNADAYSYLNLTVQVKKSKSGFAGLLKKDLESNSAFASVSASISDDIINDAEVIVGK